MKWIAVHNTDVVGEFKNEADAKTYKEAADAAAFRVNIVRVDDADFACVIRLSGLYENPNYAAYYRKDGDGFNFGGMSSATIFEGGRSNPEVQRILEHADWYVQQFNADRLEAVPFYQFTQRKEENNA